MKAVGGYFELELPHIRGSLHAEATALCTGRACISLLLKELKPRRFYLPFYTCDALLSPFEARHVPFQFYQIDENLDPIDLPSLASDEYVLYINYFGLKSRTVERLVDDYGEQLVVDNTHSFFQIPSYPGFSFTSARKYFGVPDGAYLYSPKRIAGQYPRFKRTSLAHSVARLSGAVEAGYGEFQEYESTLGDEIRRISLVSERLLSAVDYAGVERKRLRNFRFLAESLDSTNRLCLSPEGPAVPFCYPYLPEKRVEKSMLAAERVYVPSFWLDTFNRGRAGYMVEKSLSLDLLPLPIDHRYTIRDMKRILVLLRSEPNGKTCGRTSRE